MKKIPVEMLDEYMKLQEVTNDHQVRSVITFNTHLDINLLKKSIQKTFKYIPILNSSYTVTGQGNFWIRGKNNTDDLIPVHYPETSDITGFLHCTPGETGQQILFQVIRFKNHDLLIITLNHMVMDGSAFKSYLYILASIYSGKETDISCTDRRMKTLLKNIPIFSRINLFLKRTKKQPANMLLQNTKDPARVSLNLFKITPDEYNKIKSYCKTNNATLNDFIISIYAKAIFEVSNNSLSEITIQMMFDLRRYVKKYPVSEYGNFASMESVTIHNCKKFSDILSNVHESINKLKNNLPGIKNILLMHIAFSIFPVKKFNSIIKDKIRSFGISTSNIGIIDDQLLQFPGLIVEDAYMLTSVKKQPAMQLSFSTFKQTITLSILGIYSETNVNIIEKIFTLMKTIIKECINDDMQM